MLKLLVYDHYQVKQSKKYKNIFVVAENPSLVYKKNFQATHDHWGVNKYIYSSLSSTMLLLIPVTPLCCSCTAL